MTIYKRYTHGEILQNWRKAQKLTRAELSAITGIPAADIRYLETFRPPSRLLANLAQILKSLHQDPKDFLYHPHLISAETVEVPVVALVPTDTPQKRKPDPDLKFVGKTVDDPLPPNAIEDLGKIIIAESKDNPLDLI